MAGAEPSAPKIAEDRPDASPPPPGTPLYFLKTIPTLAHKSDGPVSPYATAYTNRFLRFTGSGHPDTVVTEGQPVYLRFYLSPRGEELAFSKSHPGRVWGFTIDPALPGHGEEGLQLLMFNGLSTKGFAFVDRGDGEEVLMWTDGAEVGEAEVRAWKGWLLRDTPPEKFNGNPRVFADFEAEEGSGSARVDFVRHYVEEYA